MRTTLCSFFLALFVVGCGSRTELPVCRRKGETRTCESVCGQGTETCDGYRWTSCTAPKPAPNLSIEGTVRDFHAAHPDFEEPLFGADPGIVAEQLGPDGKPVYAGKPTTLTTSGQANFDSWYRDTAGINMSAPFSLPLRATSEDAARYRFHAPNFFPIDGRLFGNEGNTHNYHFTLEVQIPFRYVGGETLTFSGDDDLWIFINDRLAINLGGVHPTETSTIQLDERADELGITPGNVFSFALFFAERHTTGSNFSLETTISEFAVCPGN